MSRRWCQSIIWRNPEGNKNENNKTAFGKILHQLIRRKQLRNIIAQTREGELIRSFGFFSLNTLGLGAIIGAGIFTVVGHAAAEFAGPAEILSLLIGTVPAVLAALSYAEMASMVPASGSSYSYIYTVMGEFCAWLVGWDLCLEYMCAAAAVAVAWANYVGSFMELVFSISVDYRLLSAPVSWNVTAQNFYLTENWISLPAVAIILFLTALIVYDVGTSSLFNNIIVVTKIIILIVFICFSIKHIDPENYHPILPESQGGDTYGIRGLFHASTISFFAFIGFDAITTAAQEATESAARRLPLSILTSLGIATILYFGIASVMLGVVNYKELNVTNPIGEVCKVIGMKWLEVLVNLAAIFGLTSVILANLYGQSRIFYSMAKDGLLMPVFSKTRSLKKKPLMSNTASSSATTTVTTGITNNIDNVKTTVTITPEIQMPNKPAGSPVWASIVTGILCAAAAGILPIDFLAETTSIGTLFAFMMVHISTIIMHWTHKPQDISETASRLSDDSEIQAMQNIKSRFRFPSRTLICPILGVLTCLLLLSFITVWTVVRFIVWNIVIGQPIYWFYGRKNSALEKRHGTNFESIDPTNPCGNNLSQGHQQFCDIAAITPTTHTIIDNRASSSASLLQMVNVHENISTFRL